MEIQIPNGNSRVSLDTRSMHEIGGNTLRVKLIIDGLYFKALF